jgi:hypothetical protein
MLEKLIGFVKGNPHFSIDFMGEQMVECDIRL